MVREPALTVVLRYGWWSLWQMRQVRSRNTRYRGPLVICTSRRATGAQDDKTVPRGVSLCIVELVDSRHMTKDDEAAAGVAWHPGAWAWIIRRPQALPRVPVTGRLGVFDLAAAVTGSLIVSKAVCRRARLGCRVGERTCRTVNRPRTVSTLAP